MDFNVITALNIDGLPLELGFVLWNRAIDCAPYDTGNLRRSILMTKNSSTKKAICLQCYERIIFRLS